ncbi:MAG: 3-keto-5-aminohexanoate cleavage protein [Rhizobiaceae bacterium]|nr:3-keto-5-aminohexanoate cleavage protein [Rhizobiaceae bacterium]
MTLPRIMVAPNGAHKTKRDHPALPISLEEIIDTAISCRDAGAGGLHAHVRDVEGKHVLDAGLYLELLIECETKLPGMYVQITTEAVGIYTARQQDELVRRVEPNAVSVALREMAGCGDEKLAREFYHRTQAASIDVQHILYASDEVDELANYIKSGVVPAGDLQLLFVLGRYAHNQQSSPDELMPFLSALKRAFSSDANIDWAVCAFGRNETLCLVKSAELGGKVRVGFENSLWNGDGKIAVNNAERVREIASAIDAS